MIGQSRVVSVFEEGGNGSRTGLLRPDKGFGDESIYIYVYMFHHFFSPYLFSFFFSFILLYLFLYIKIILLPDMCSQVLKIEDIDL